MRAWEVAGAAVLCIGVGLLSSERSTKPIGLSFGSFSHWPAAAAIAVIAFLCVQAGRRQQGRARALLTGIAAGLVYGVQDALTRQTLEVLQSGGISALFTTWAPYALLGAGAIGIWLMQSAFSAAPAVSATSVSPAAVASASACAYASYAVASLPMCSSACPKVNLTLGDDRMARTAWSFSAASAQRPAFARSTASL